MKPSSILKVSLLTFILTFTNCSKEEIVPDKSIGEWSIYSISDENGTATIWEDIKSDLVELIPEYACMSFTASISEKIVTTIYEFIDINSRGCLSPSYAVYTWSIDPETGFYQYVQGSNVINYSISFSNNDTRMTWIDQKSGAITVWDKDVELVAESTE